MKLACVVLFISLAAASVAQLQATAPRPDVCYEDLECKLVYGDNCFCLNPGHLQPHGDCKCHGFDPDFLNGNSVPQMQATAPRPDVCYTDLECKLVYGNHCFCLNPGHLQPHGDCKCLLS